MQNPTKTQAWLNLAQHHFELRDVAMRDLFAADHGRFAHFSQQFTHGLLDYSKNRITQKTVDLLCAFAEEMQLANAIDRLQSGKIVNPTEQRAATHMQLRDCSQSALELARIESIVTALYQKTYLGFSGKPITDVIHVGIGGSLLGPQFICEALESSANKAVKTHFVTHFNSQQIAKLLKLLNPETTLLIVASKSFTTRETMHVSNQIRDWFIAATGSVEQAAQHFIAITAKTDVAKQYGVNEENILSMDEAVGGRYSLWSNVGLIIAIALGMDAFKALLSGAHDMDKHFCQTDFAKNVPVIMALLGVWYNNFFNAHSRAVIPYNYALRTLPDYLKQLHMESLGKSTDLMNQAIDYATGPILWGGLAPNCQHSFHQLFMQGTQLVPIDFIIAKKNVSNSQTDDELLANCFAQSKALMEGFLPEAKNEQYRYIKGNNVSNTLLLDEISPSSLGALLALYEHKVYTQSILWNINAFDQWGVERGKVLADAILQSLQQSTEDTTFDSSTRGLLHAVRRQVS